MVALALALDVALGDPPNRWHPVAWIGALVGWGRRRLAHGPPTRLRGAGAALLVTVAAVAAVAGGVVVVAARAAGPVGLLVEALALSALLSVRGLTVAARRVARRLEARDLVGARSAVGTDLVSRSTALLDRGHVASAAIESVAENLTDSIVAPITFYLAFGLPGAAVYRAVNTADAMIGYRGGVLEHFGRATARLDDLLNLVPARLAACALVIAAPFAGASARGALAIAWRHHRRTASPNAGWTMAAMAGALGLTLEKPEAYVLGTGPLPEPADIDRSLRVLVAATLVALVAAAVVIVLIHPV